MNVRSSVPSAFSRASRPRKTPFTARKFPLTIGCPFRCKAIDLTIPAPADVWDANEKSMSPAKGGFTVKAASALVAVSSSLEITTEKTPESANAAVANTRWSFVAPSIGTLFLRQTTLNTAS